MVVARMVDEKDKRGLMLRIGEFDGEFDGRMGIYL